MEELKVNKKNKIVAHPLIAWLYEYELITKSTYRKLKISELHILSLLNIFRIAFSVFFLFDWAIKMGKKCGEPNIFQNVNTRPD